MAFNDPFVDSDARPEGLQEFVSRRLVRAIITGEVRPGQRLSPARLAEQLGVSHIPVREALAALEALGHVTRVARVGFFVAELSLEDIEDIYHWREVLEDEAHHLAMPRLTDGDLETMRDVNDRMLAAAREHTTQFLGLNRQFHFIPFERAGSRHLLRFLTHLWDAAARYEHAIAFVELPKSLLQEHHSSLLAAFAARDVEAANDAMRQHRAVARDVISRMANVSRADTSRQ